MGILFVSFNLRREFIEDGKNRFENRKPFIQEKLEHENADVICFQEVLPEALDWLKQILCAYSVVGCGRDQNLGDEATAIAYKKKRFNLIQMDTFWLSNTPTIPGSRYENQSICPRTCTVVLLQDMETDLIFRVYNTHQDHEGVEARICGSRQMIRRMKEETLFKEAPAVLMGDFNACPTEESIKICTEEGGLEDFTKELKGSFHEFGKLKTTEKIDYIFGSSQLYCNRCGLWEDSRDGLYLSDHYPVYAEIDVKIRCRRNEH